MKKLLLPTLTCLLATHSYAAVDAQAAPKTASKPAATKPVEAQKTASSPTPTAKLKPVNDKTPTKASATANTPLASKTSSVNAIGITEDDKQNGIDNDYTDGAGVAGNTLKLQALLDWNHTSPGPIDGGWGMNAKTALKNFQAMHGLPQDGRMSEKVWQLLNKNIPANQPVLVGYTLTEDDIKGPYQATPSGSEAKSKMKGLYYQDIQEMLAERFHMDIRYLKKLNADKAFKAGETITVFNPGDPLKQKITRIVAKKSDNILYAYNGDKLIATYPTTVGSSDTPSPTGTYTIVNRVKNPWYRATSGEGKDKKVFMLPPGPNGPVGVVWMGLSKPSFGIHGSPIPEGISRQASHGCVRLTNWDVLEVYANVDTGTKVDLQ